MRTVNRVIFLPHDRTHFEWDEIEKLKGRAVTDTTWTIKDTLRAIEHDFDGITYTIVAGNDNTTIGYDPRTVGTILHERTIAKVSGWDEEKFAWGTRTNDDMDIRY